jgi:O-antigen/teichoic acid export membrane protein
MIIKSTLWLLVSFITGKAVASIWQLCLARIFTGSTETYGYYMLLLTQYSVWVLLAEGGLTYAVQQFVAENKDDPGGKIKEYWPFIVVARMILGALAAIIFGLIMVGQYPGLLIPVVVLSLSLFVYALGTSPLGLWAGKRDFRLEAKSSILSTLVFVVLAGLVVLFSKSITLLVLCSLISAIVQGIYVWKASLHDFGIPRGMFSSLIIYWKKFSTFCFPLLFSSFIFRFFYKGDMMEITGKLGPEKAGVYSIALMLFFLASDLLWSQFAKAYTPALISSWETLGKCEDAENKLRQVFSFYAFVGILSLGFIHIWGEMIMGVIFGPGSPWISATGPFFWMMVGFFPVVMYALLYRILLLERGTMPYLLISFILITLKFLFIFSFSRVLGLNGMALTNSVLMLIFCFMIVMLLGENGKKLFLGTKTMLKNIMPTIAAVLIFGAGSFWGISKATVNGAWILLVVIFMLINAEELKPVFKRIGVIHVK